jgi:hypothetical protein
MTAKLAKTQQCAAILMVSAEIRRRLSYQACSIPRIVRPPDMTVCGDRQLVIIF